MPDFYEIQIRKEALKFASSHMTVFNDGTKEALHGHQYLPTVTLQIRNSSFDQMILFSEIKLAMKKIAKLWDEKVLIATENPYYQLKEQNEHSLLFELCKKKYLLPSDEVVLLKVDNVTCENLARAYFQFLSMALSPKIDFTKDENILSVSVFIEESPGQGARYIFQKKSGMTQKHE